MFFASNLIHCSTFFRHFPGPRLVSSSGAKGLLGLQEDVASVQELRAAYFRKSKECHPDIAGGGSYDFLQLTDAYECLLRELNGNAVTTSITYDEELAFRMACEEHLGISAEMVEECKKNPMFQTWLSGRTDGAQHWRAFLSQHGGLATKLRSLAVAAGESVKANQTRRSRRRK
jgi:hypothetical protein